jgi:hypothetical protein
VLQRHHDSYIAGCSSYLTVRTHGKVSIQVPGSRHPVTLDQIQKIVAGTCCMWIWLSFAMMDLIGKSLLLYWMVVKISFPVSGLWVFFSVILNQRVTWMQ